MQLVIALALSLIAGAGAQLTGQPLGAYCGGNGRGGVYHEFRVRVANQKMPSAQGTGDLAGGLLDNLRGQCGVITDWEAVDDGDGFRACFKAVIECGSDNVHDAIYLASDDQLEVNCSYADDADLPGQVRMLRYRNVTTKGPMVMS